MANTQRLFTLQETLDDINQWIDQNNDPDDEVEDDLEDLDGDLDENDDNEEMIDAVDNDLSDTDDEPPSIPRFPKPLTKKRKVNSIDAALDITNYNPMTYLNCRGDWEDLTGFLGPKSNPNTPTITWTNEEPLQRGRQRACDVISSPVSCLEPHIDIQNEVDAYDQLIDLEMHELFVTQRYHR